MEKIRSIFLLACCVLIAIGPLNLMQMIAWGSMLQDYSKDRTLGEAAEMTFSGEHPCEMCRKISEARNKENQPDQPAPAPSEERKNIRLDFHLDEAVASKELTWSQAPVYAPGNTTLIANHSREDQVPTPPPRFQA